MRQVHIHTDLKWSSKKQSGLEMPQLAAEWPRHPLRDQLGQHGATEGLSGYDQAAKFYKTSKIGKNMIPSAIS